MLLFEKLIESEKWVLAFEKGLALIAAFSEIEFGKNGYQDNEKFKKWFKTYAIENFDILIKEYPYLQAFMLNGKTVEKKQLEQINLANNKRKSLEYIIYKIRCSDFHSQKKIIPDIKINKQSAVFRLRLDEDNIFEQSEETIYLCPHFFTELVLCSLKHYIKTLRKDTDKHERYKEFCQYNVDSIEVTLKIPPMVTVVSSGKLDCEMMGCINADKSIDISEVDFTVERSNYFIKVNYDQIYSIKTDNNTQKFMIFFNEEIKGYSGLHIDLEHPKLNELKSRISCKRNI